LKLKDIAAKLGLVETQIRKWKCQDKWEQKVSGGKKVTLPKKQDKRKGNVTNKKGAPKGNKNAQGNKGGHGGPPGNNKAECHGFFKKIFPDDPETMEIIEGISIKSPLDILWENIVIQYTAIARAQRIMYVKNQDDLTKVLKRQKESSGMHSDSWEKEYELQFAWDKQANFLQAQSRAMSTLQGMIAKYEDLLLKELATEEQKARIAKLKAEVAKISNTGNEESEDWLAALKQVADRRKAQVSANE
jgi:phage terminase small subunit